MQHQNHFAENVLTGSGSASLLLKLSTYTSCIYCLQLRRLIKHSLYSFTEQMMTNAEQKCTKNKELAIETPPILFPTLMKQMCALS